MAETIRVFVVDDHPLLREGIAAVLGNQPDMALLGEAGNGRDAIALFPVLKPDITLMDLKLPDISGIDAIEQIRKVAPDAKIIVLTTYRGDVQAGRALKAGARGYLLKEMVRKDLVEAVRTVIGGKRYVPPEIALEIADHAGEAVLTARELVVLKQVALGCANKVIGANLSVSEDTVKSNIRSILSKLGANDRTHAVTIAVRRGFLDL
jgi:DNA-binding NarL/FixJ family response regulator